MNEFLTFQRYNNKVQAEELIRVLEMKEIPYEVEDYSAAFDAAFANNRLTSEISVKIRQQDFEQVHQWLLEAAAEDIQEPEQDHYLFDFSDEELLEIITKPDEWSHYDFSLALKILKSRGKEVNPELVRVLRKNRVQELSKPESDTRRWIILGYGLVLLGGLFGVFMGGHIASHKKILPNGDKVYAFSEEDRRHGVIITFIGIAVILVGLFFKIGEALS